jgi:hypothetical protein
MRQRGSNTRSVGGNEPPYRAHDEGEPASAIAPTGAGRLDVRDPLPEDIRDPSFPAAVRGYDRQRARETTEEITTSAREVADDTTARAKAEAQDIASLHDEAEARMRSLQTDVAAISDERRTLLDDIRRITARLDAVVAGAEQVESEMPPEAARPGGAD